MYESARQISRASMPVAKTDGGALFERIPSEACAELHRRWAACLAKHAAPVLLNASSVNKQSDDAHVTELVLSLLYSAFAEGNAAR